MNGILLRRVAVFAAVFVPGMSLVGFLAGGLRTPPPGAPRPQTPPAPPTPPDGRPPAVVPIDRGPGLGPGRRGRLDSDSVAVVGNRAVHYRAWTAEWETSEPQPPPEPGVSMLLLTGARVLVFPEPAAGRESVAREDAPGTTLVAGRECLLRQREQAPPSAHLEGDALAQHALEDGQRMTLRSEALDFRTEERGPHRIPVRVVETDRPVRIEGGGATIDGTGLLAELARDRPRARIEKDVKGVLQQREGGDPVRLSCGGPAFLEALDRPARASRATDRESLQPWRATFREDVRVEERGGTLTADEAAVEFVRTTAADRAAGAPATVIRRMTAAGEVVVESSRERGAVRATSDRLTRFAEDVLTDKSVFEGSPRFTFEAGGAKDGSRDGAPGATSVFSVRCTGPAEVRERRARLGDARAETVTIVFEGDVVVLETDAATQALRSDLRAPRVTIEGRRGDDGGFVPLLARAERGAEFRRTDAQGRALSGRAKTIVWTERRPGADARLSLVGEPAVAFTEKEGVSPFGGTARPGVLEVRSKDRIDVDFAPPRTSADRTGPPSRATVLGGMLLRKTAGDEELWRLTSDRGDAVFGPAGEVRELRAWGRARLASAEGADREGFVAGERIAAVRRPEATTDATRAEDLDVTVFGSQEVPAVAVIGDAEAPLHHEVRARTLRHEKGGAVIVASGDATADLRVAGAVGDVAAATRPAVSPLRLRAAEIRADVDRAEGKPSELRLLSATGGVEVDESLHRLVADRATYEERTGRVEAWGDPVRILRRRGKDPSARAGADDWGGSFLHAPHVRAFFDRRAKGPDSFLRATCPEGGTLVAHHAAAPEGSDVLTRRRVTIRSEGPMDLERDAASAAGKAVAVWEREMPDGRWQSVARIDGQRMDAAFEPRNGKLTRDDLRSFVASGSADDPARLQARNESGTRDVVALAERMEAHPSRTRIRLSCPSGRSRVFVRDVVSGSKWMCDAADYDYETWEFTMERATEVE